MGDIITFPSKSSTTQDASDIGRQVLHSQHPGLWPHMCAGDGSDSVRIQVFTPMGQPCKECGCEYRKNQP